MPTSYASRGSRRWARSFFVASTAILLLFAPASGDIFSYRKLEFLALEDYPKLVAEAQGGVMGPSSSALSNSTAGDAFSLLICGGFHNFPNVTSDCYSMPFSQYIRPNEGNWTFETSLPVPLTHCATSSWGDRMYFCGGFHGSHPGPSVDNCFYYDRTHRNWTQLPDLPGKRSGGSLVHLTASKLFYAGGVVRYGTIVDGVTMNGSVDYGDAWVLDTKNSSNGWVSRAPMPNPRNHMGSVGLWCGDRRRVFFVGGQHAENEMAGNQDSLHEYVIETGEWEDRAAIPTPAGHIMSSLVEYGCGFLMHGGVHDADVDTDEIWYYNAITDGWSLAGKFPIPAKSPVCGASPYGNLMCSFDGTTFESWLTQLQGMHGDSSLYERRRPDRRTSSSGS